MKWICGLQLPRGLNRSTRLLQPTGRWAHGGMWLELRSFKSTDVEFLNQIRWLPSWGLVNPLPDLIHVQIVEAPGIEYATSWLVVRHADHSANEAVKTSCYSDI